MSNMRSDIGIVTVIGAELRAMQEALGIDNKADRFPSRGDLFWRSTVRANHSGRVLSVVVHCIGRPGMQAASAAATRMIERFSPSVLILAGIAAGRRTKIKIGDVAIPRSVADTSLKVAEAGELRGRPQIPSLPHVIEQMLSAFHLNTSHWHETFKRLVGFRVKAPPGQEIEYAKHVAEIPSLHDITISSDNLLLRDAEVLETQAQVLHQHIRIGEMEAGGFITACEARHPTIPWLVVRGVSDFGDDFKNDQFHRLASCAAASYVAEFLTDGFDHRLIETQFMISGNPSPKEDVHCPSESPFIELNGVTTSVDNESLRIDDVIVNKEQRCVVLDVRIRNMGQQTVNITRAILRVLSRTPMMAAYKESASYDLLLSGEYNEVSIAHVLRPDEVDKLSIRIGFTRFNTSCVFQAELILRFNGERLTRSTQLTFASFFVD